MPSISGAIPNLIGGVSQQPGAQRLENTAESLKNAIPSVVSGLKKRGPTKFTADLMANPTTTAALHTINRPGKGTHLIVAANNTLKVFDSNGVEQTVNLTSTALSYLTTTDPEKDLGFLTIADTTFIFNRSKTVGSSSTSDSRHSLGEYVTYVVEQTAYQTKYDILKNGTSIAEYTTSSSAATGVTNIASQLSTLIGGLDVSSHTLRGNVISMKPNTPGTPFQGYPDTLSRMYVDEIDLFTNLPTYEVDGRIVRVAADADDADSDYYYVEYDATKGVWKETLAQGEKRRLNQSTMPHVLVDNGNGTWDVDDWSWKSRLAGDSTVNPEPSFVGQTINDMFIRQNRMCILTDENLVMSEVGVYENFWRTTTSILRADDRIDVAVVSSDNRVAILHHGISFSEGLLLFSDKHQFKVQDGDGLAAGAFSVRPTTSFNASVAARPLLIGKNVVFVDETDQSTWADIREYYLDNVTGVEDSEVITKQIPEYIPSGVHRIISNSTADVMCVFTKGDRSKLFLYSYFWSNSERLQSAWNHWESEGSEFITGDFVDNLLYLITRRDGRLYLEYVDLQETLLGDFDGVEVMLDHRVNQTDATVVFDGTNSTVTLPYTVSTDTFTLVVTGGGTLVKGTTLTPASQTGNDLVFSDVDLSAENFLVGIIYSFEYELSPIYVRDKGNVAIQDNRLQLRYLSIQYHQSTYFRVEVTPVGRATASAVFTGRYFDDPTNVFGTVPVASGEFRVATPGEPTKTMIKIVNDSPFTCRFSAIEWEASWRPRTRRYR